MKTFSVISDVTFDLILKKIDDASFTLRSYHFGNIIPSLLAPSGDLIYSDNVILHFDSFFYRYTIEELSEILSASEQFSKNYRGNLLISNSLSQTFPKSLSETIGEYGDGLNELRQLIESLKSQKNTYFYDFQKLISNIGLQHAYNFHLGHLYQMPYTKPVIEDFSRLLNSYLKFISEPEKKVIIVDCDNTLWNGILGEDGIDKIQCDKNVNGVLHLHFQHFLKQKKSEGFLLCICSKNNEDDVIEAFEKKSMPLKYDDFIIKKVNWHPKTQNIIEISEELSLGLESFIFIDDSSFEIESVNKILPQVHTFKFEKNYTKFLALTDDFAFKRKRLTAEDADKTAQYRAEQKRKDALQAISSFEDYVKQLDLKMEITVNNLNEIERYAQMTEKTNQFNFNKEIFSVKDLQNFIHNGNFIFGLKVSDKFGDYGVVGLILVQVENNHALLRNYLMSCRALGRGIEDNFFEQVLSMLTEKNISLTEIQFKETSKNKPAQDFYAKISKHYAKYA